nr:MAG TPA: hypothetical protein [Caudoviricetes sp.]
MQNEIHVICSSACASLGTCRNKPIAPRLHPLSQEARAAARLARAN